MRNRTRYILAFAITTLVFLLGLFIGSNITASKTQDIEKSLQNDILEFQSLELELALIKDGAGCEYIASRLPELVKRKVELGTKFDVGNIPKEDAEILQKQYVISLMRYWLFSDVHEKQCNITSPRIMFFFDDSEQSREQGRILDYIVYRSNQTVTVFSFNTEWNSPLIRLLAVNNQIQKNPTIVIGAQKYEGLQQREEIEKIFCRYYSILC